MGQVCVSRSSGQGQGLRSKKPVCVSCLHVVFLRLKGNLIIISIVIIVRLQLAVLEEGYGPSMTSDEPGDGEEDESVDTKEHSPPQPASAPTSRSSLPLATSTEELSVKKKPPSRIAGPGLRAPTAGKSEFFCI